MNINLDVSNYRKAKYAKNEFKVTKKVTKYSEKKKLIRIAIYFFKIVIVINIGDVGYWY